RLLLGVPGIACHAPRFWAPRMKPCPHCGHSNDAGSNFCRQCGRALVPAEATLRWTGQKVASLGLPRALPVASLFAGKKKISLGRAADCDVCLPHPTISRYHAEIEHADQGLRLRDLASVNGVLVGGRPIAEPVWLKERERVGVGPILCCLAGGVLYFLDNSLGLRLEARNLAKTQRIGLSKVRRLLYGIKLPPTPRE